MQPIDAFKPLGIVTVVILICGLLFLLWRWPQGRHMTFSQHAAQYRSAIIYYFLIFTIILPLLLLFFIGWFAPAFQLPPLFILFVVAAALFQYSVAIVPEVGGWKTTYHVGGSTVSAACMLLALVVMLFAVSISGFSKVIIAASILTMITFLVIGAKTRITHPHLLLLQASYYTAFFTAVLGTTYLG